MDTSRAYMSRIINAALSGDQKFVNNELTIALISFLVLAAIVILLVAIHFHHRNESDALAKEIQDACEMTNPNRFREE